MMKKNIFFYCFVLLSSLVYAQEAGSIFVKANSNYVAGNFEQAIEDYHSIIDQGFQSDNLYYNLANSYYKTDNIAYAILYYKRAIKINPAMEDAKFNLEMAQARTVDKIEKLPEGVILKIWNWFSNMFNLENWAQISIVFSFISAILFMIYLLTSKSSLKRLSFVLSFSFFALLVLSLIISYQQKAFIENNREAVVISENSYVKLAPNQSSEDSFILHEGTTVVVIDEIGDWKRIKLADGKMGWIIINDITFV